LHANLQVWPSCITDQFHLQLWNFLERLYHINHLIVNHRRDLGGFGGEIGVGGEQSHNKREAAARDDGNRLWGLCR
jgi:hypothetical protein